MNNSDSILQLQDDGDHQGACNRLAEMNAIYRELPNDLDRLLANNMPAEVIFDPGQQELRL